MSDPKQVSTRWLVANAACSLAGSVLAGLVLPRPGVLRALMIGLPAGAFVVAVALAVHHLRESDARVPSVPASDPSVVDKPAEPDSGFARDWWLEPSSSHSQVAVVPPRGEPGQLVKLGPGVAPPIETSTYERQGVRRARLPQCPACGQFVALWRNKGGRYSFVCRACRHRWAWTLGDPWQATLIDPRLPGLVAQQANASRTTQTKPHPNSPSDSR